MQVIFLFVDGVGLGKKGVKNTLADDRWDGFSHLTGGQGLSIESTPVHTDELLFTGVDTNLEMEGLPQSGTGQATLFSGENAAKLAGKHFGPYPHSKTRFLLEEKSLFHQAIKKGYKPHFINAYPEIFFKSMRARKRWTCTTLMAVSSGQTLNGVDDIRSGKAITAEIIQQAWRKQLGLEVDDITTETAASRLVEAAGRYDLVLFEYYLTDKAGHSQSSEKSVEVLTVLNRFINDLLTLKNSDTALVLCSDHGNLEDLSVKTHTRNPVPFIVHGRGLKNLDPPRSIMDVPGIVLKLLEM